MLIKEPAMALIIKQPALLCNFVLLLARRGAGSLRAFVVVIYSPNFPSFPS